MFCFFWREWCEALKTGWNVIKVHYSFLLLSEECGHIPRFSNSCKSFLSCHLGLLSCLFFNISEGQVQTLNCLRGGSIILTTLFLFPLLLSILIISLKQSGFFLWPARQLISECSSSMCLMITSAYFSTRNSQAVSYLANNQQEALPHSSFQNSSVSELIILLKY